MKLLLLTLVLSLSVICYVNASSSFDDLAREQLWEMLEADRSTNDDSIEIDRRDKSYKDAQKHPERLRLCVKCVGKEREKGKNVKASVAHCNAICRRGIFDTRSVDMADFEERNLF